MAKKKETEDHSTEEKIIQAARKVFTQKGYAATRTRDIAEEAGINLALLNYYFRSKEKLFELIMMEILQKFAAALKDILNDEDTAIEKKLELMADKYIDMLISQPNFPLFMLSEIQAQPEKLIKKMGVKDFFRKSVFARQLGELLQKNKYPVHPLHLMMNFIGVTVFPFIGKPLLKEVGNISEKEFNEMMLQRKKLIPVWIKAVIKAS